MHPSYECDARHNLNINYTALGSLAEEEGTINQEDHHQEQFYMKDMRSAPLITSEGMETHMHLSANGTKLNDEVYVNTSELEQKKPRNGCLQWISETTRAIVLYLATGLAIVVLVLNVILYVFAKQNDQRIGSTSIYNGPCKEATRLSTLWHIAINVLSTLLLGASNFTMQTLVAPTREDIDYAHSQGKQLDIGIPSIDNLRFIPKLRKALFLLLCFSSLPLHLFYNSTVYTITSADTFDIVIVYEQFLNSTGPYPSRFTHNQISNATLQNYAQSALQIPWKNMTLAECAMTYDQQFLQGYSTLLRVVSEAQHDYIQDDILDITKGYIDTWRYQARNLQDESDPSTYTDGVLYTGSFDATDSTYIIERLAAYTAERTTFTFPTSYCLAQPSPDHCQVKFSPTILIIVIFFNIIKAICLCVTAWQYGSTHTTISTVGDAIQSFLERPDESVKGLCSASGKDLTSNRSSYIDPWASARQSILRGTNREGVGLGKDSRRWYFGATRRRWYLSLSISVSIVSMFTL